MKDGTRSMSPTLLEDEAYNAFMKPLDSVWAWRRDERALRKAERKSTLDFRALRDIPELDHIESFRSMRFDQRQRVLAKLRRLEAKVNIKGLPAAVGLLSAATTLIVASNRDTSSASKAEPAVAAAPTPTPAPVTPSVVTSTPIPSPTPSTTPVPTPTPTLTQDSTQDGFAWVLDLPYFPSVFEIVAIVLGIGAGFLLFEIGRHRKHESCLNAWTAAFVDSHALKTKIEEEERKADAEQLAKEKADAEELTKEQEKAPLAVPTVAPAAQIWRPYAAPHRER